MNTTLVKRDVGVDHFFCSHRDKPHDIFFMKIGGDTFVGKKYEADFLVDGKVVKRKTCLVEEGMLFGKYRSMKVCEKGYSFFYEIMSEQEKHQAFDRVLKMDGAYLYYPFLTLNEGGGEELCSQEQWMPSLELERELNDDEIPLREIAINKLKEYGQTKGVFYDPACSTGKFLETMKNEFKGIYTIGQDINPKMVEVSSLKLDETICGDSIKPCVRPSSVDVLVFRFLNSFVVSAADADILFRKLITCLKPGGVSLVFGHTPVLLSFDYFVSQGLEVLSSVAKPPGLQSVCEFYVLRKKD
ncbi:class I SAM-dependent methyltransferase [Teredinibacter sp. KSP-S5-2]|uniref:class I SAM-dependent methyltransferase n=1 Tax=Teredinibacter sp. KSP-S5-2 TaxID=3034506 RepID=UPI0029344B6D|nr:class I SAM-dependent methyltransferase [Teredinibacter sp. KSP-S5-2]WNO11597.1 class I SAM-dependent methyltransferase [Teredinibacter sp. KSP-S5-2]